jgi:hypothetical protein
MGLDRSSGCFGSAETNVGASSAITRLASKPCDSDQTAEEIGTPFHF